MYAFYTSLCANRLCPNARTVTGVVVDEFGDPIIGAAIKIVDSTVGTISDIDGKFSLLSRKGEDWLFHL